MPLSPRRSRFLHYRGYLQLALVIVAGACCLIAIALWHWFGQPSDLEVIIALIVVGLFGLGYGAFALQRHMRRDPTTPIPTVDDLSPAEAAIELRIRMSILAFISILASAFLAYQLAQLEFGLEQRVWVWGPVKMIYELFGFWPAVLFVPVLGLLALFSLARKLRAIKEGQTGRI